MNSKNNTLTIITTLFFSTLLIGCKKEIKAQQNEVSTIENTKPIPFLEHKVEAKLGEGAFWNHKTQELYWIDIYTIDLDSGKVTMLSDVENKMTENRFNDGKCDPSGNLWVGSMHLNQSKPNANLYKVTPKGKAIKMLDNITISNGIVWTSDAKTMYYIDTPTGNIRAFDFDISTNTIKNERIAVVVPESLGYPDGMAIDEENMLWVGMWNGNAIVRFNPKTGKVITKIEVPAHNVTACAFGGKNLDELYITTASIDMTDEEKKRFPLAGSIFKVKPGVKGVKSVFFGSQQK